MVSRELCAHVKSILGVDISQKMVDIYNLRVNQQGIPPEEMRAVRVMLEGKEGELGGAKFDVVICTASYHHFPDIHSITRMLFSFLKPGGSLLVADILNESHTNTHPEHPQHDAKEPELLEKYKHIVVHKSGFTETEMRENLEGAGLRGFEFHIAASASLHGKDVKFFLARGVKQ